VVGRVVQSFLDKIVLEMSRNNRIEFRDFGILKVCTREARVAQIPKTMEKVKVPVKRTVKFKTDRLLKKNSATTILRQKQNSRHNPNATILYSCFS